MKQFLLIILLIIATKVAFPQNVTNIQVEQIGKKVHVTYTLDKTADITLHLSTDGGVTYSDPLKQVSGDVGKNIPVGTHTIVWDVLSEKDKLVGDDFVFLVKASSNSNSRDGKSINNNKGKIYPKSTFIMLNYAYSTAPQSSYGFTIGQVKSIGWYISAMSNFNFLGISNPFTEGVYLLNGESSTTRLSLTGGVVFRVGNPFSLKIGAGVGYRSFNLQTQNNNWYSYPSRTFFGLDASMGLYLHLNSFIISAEVVTVNFKYVEAKFGIGFCIDNN